MKGDTRSVDYGSNPSVVSWRRVYELQQRLAEMEAACFETGLLAPKGEWGSEYRYHYGVYLGIM